MTQAEATSTEFPVLYKRTSTGAIQQWEIQVLVGGGSDGALIGNIITVHGQVGGKKQTDTEVVSSGKNVGRSNETTAVEQALADARSKWEQKVKKGYVQSRADAEAGAVDAEYVAGGVSPMLAFKYEEQGHKIKYPAYSQPKLDGHRCVAMVGPDGVTLWSRTRKRINSVPHIAAAIGALGLPAGTVLDGELYNHDYRDNFEALTSKIRKDSPQPGHEAVQYWIYDIADPRLGQAERVEALRFLERREMSGPLVVVPTEMVADEEEMVGVFGAYVANGFEGLMVRNAGGKYKNGRSYDLQKVKTMADAEFEVTGVREGKGRMAGLAIFECRTEQGEAFTVKMEGALENLRQYVQNPSLAVGRQLTVRYQNMTGKGVPRFPVGVRLREDV